MKIGYDGISCIEERKVTGGNEELIFHYVNGIRIDEVINFFHFFGASGTEYYYHYDGKGWVTALTEGNESGQTPGAIHRRYEYTPYGVTAIFDDGYAAIAEADAFDVTDNTLAYNRTLYAGREYDPETNLYYYRARHYSPETGRFIQRDPIGYGDEYCLMNLYCYVGNNPITYIDSKGKKRENPHGKHDVYSAGEGEYQKCYYRVDALFRGSAFGTAWDNEKISGDEATKLIFFFTELACGGLPGDPVKNRKNWKSYLPKCIVNISNRNMELRGWTKEDPERSQKYHPGSCKCYRKEAENSAWFYSIGNLKSRKGEDFKPVQIKGGQQCCYDDKGQLLKTGAGAGTPDIHAAVGGLFDGSSWVSKISHWKTDVDIWEFLGEEKTWDIYHGLGWSPDQGIDLDDPSSSNEN